MGKPTYKRVLLKLSGESMADRVTGESLSIGAIEELVAEIKELHSLGVQVAIVIGGGNLFRGASSTAAAGMERSTADSIGMLATMINSLALQDFLEKEGIPTTVMSSSEMPRFALTCNVMESVHLLEKGNIVIFGGGTGNPYFSTDTAAVLRALEVHADVVLKGTKVDGVFDSDPVRNPNAKFFEELTYIDVLNKNLKVMDATAISMCMENNLPIVVFNMFQKGNVRKVMKGQKVGTYIYGKATQ